MRRIRVVTHVGTRAYAHCTTLGKVLIAFLDKDERKKIYKKIGFPRMTKNTIVDRDLFEKEIIKVREQGFALDDEENEYDIRCIAAPIIDYSGKVIAAISISGPSFRFNLKRQKLLKNNILKYS